MEMMKRPIAHFDPALYTAHVMLMHRAPFNPNEKQTSILMRDIIANVRAGSPTHYQAKTGGNSDRDSRGGHLFLECTFRVSDLRS